MRNPFPGLLLVLLAVVAPALWDASAAAGPSEQDRRFVEAAARAETARIESAEQALTKASDNRVRIFAERIIEDHRPINEELAALSAAVGASAPPQAGARPSSQK